MGEKTYVDYPFKTEPFQHQLSCWRKSKDEREWAHFLDMGCGKSWLAINEAAYLYDKREIDGMLVVAPKGMYAGWFDEQVPEHLPDHIKREMVLYSSYMLKDDRAALARVLKPSRDALHILIINVESLNAKGLDVAQEFIKNHRTYMVVDESTTIKNPTAGRTKKTIKLGRRARYRRIMSGNPMPNGPLDLYSQCDFLDPHHLGFASFFSFRSRYAVMVDRKFGARSFKQIVGYQDSDDLTRRLRSFSFIIKKEDCLNLPRKIRMAPIKVEMGPQQKEAYDQMADSSMVLLENTPTVTALIVITQLLKLHQIACGFMKADDGSIVRFEPNPRLEALKETLEGINGKSIIWCTYHENIEQVASMIGEVYGPESYVKYYGPTSGDDRRSAKAAFQDPKSRVRFFIGSPATGKYGLQLTASHDVLYYSNSYDLEQRDQSEDRVHRIGQEFPCTYTDFVCPGTVDERIILALKNKKKLTDSIVVSNWRWILGLDKKRAA